MEKKKSSLGKALLNIVLLVPSLFSLVSNITSLIGKEARLAGKSLIAIILLLFVLGTLIISTWGCLLALLFFYLISLQWSSPLAIFIIMMVNILTLIFIYLIILKYKKNLFFPKTCRQLLKK